MRAFSSASSAQTRYPVATMPFETFKRQRAKPGGGPELTIQRRGTFSLNQAAYEALGRPQVVELLYDVEERLVGIRKVDTDTPHGYVVRPLGRGSTHLISGTAFTNWYDIETLVARRWSATVSEDGMLVIDLKQPGAETVSNRTVARRPSEAHAEP
jgi:hypothetical protein